jgi:HlyD family secretion protein
MKIEKIFVKFFDFLSNMSENPIKVGIIFIYIFVFVFFLWGFLAKIDSASVSQGNVILDSNQKIIQHLEGGIIEKIFVKEGDFVKKGQALIALNKISADSNLNILSGELMAEKTNENRLVSEIEGKNFINRYKNTDYKNIEIIETQKKFFESRQMDLNNKINICENQIEQLKEEIKGLEIQKKSTEEQLFLFKKELETVEILVSEGYETETRFLNIKRSIEELNGNIGKYFSEIAKAKQSISKLKLEIFNIKNERKNEILNELKETQKKIIDLDSKITNAKDILDRVIIRTEHDGIVSDMKFYTIGGVIPPHTDIMTIIPQNDDLIIESKISPQDIDNVNIGLKAKVNISAYKSRYVPALFGEVIYVAPDKITDPATKMSYYIIKIKIDHTDIRNKKIIEDKNIKLYPGMPVEVFVITGKRTFFQYLFDPILKTFRRGFREE